MSRASTVHEPLVERLLAAHPGRTAEQVMAERAEALRLEAGQSSLPIDVEGIASLVGIRRRMRELAFAGRVYVEEATGQLVMDLNADDPEPRRRFTCGHEIMHTEFPGFKREARYRADTVVGGAPGARGEEEWLCDVGSAALLMPADLVRSRFSAGGGLRDMEALAHGAEVSLEASAIRLVSLSDEPVAFLVLEVGNKPADRPALRQGKAVPPRLRVRYSVRAGVRTHVPRYKSADDSSILVEALSTDGIVTGIGPLPGDPARRMFDIQANLYPRNDGDVSRVLAFARPVESTGPRRSGGPVPPTLR